MLVFARPGVDVFGDVSDWGDNIGGVADEGCEVAERICASSLSDKPVGIVTGIRSGITRSGGADDDCPGTALALTAPCEEYVPDINGCCCSVI